MCVCKSSCLLGAPYGDIYRAYNVTTLTIVRELLALFRESLNKKAFFTHEDESTTSSHTTYFFFLNLNRNHILFLLRYQDDDEMDARIAALE